MADPPCLNTSKSKDLDSSYVLKDALYPKIYTSVLNLLDLLKKRINFVHLENYHDGHEILFDKHLQDFAKRNDLFSGR